MAHKEQDLLTRSSHKQAPPPASVWYSLTVNPDPMCYDEKGEPMWASTEVRNLSSQPLSSLKREAMLAGENIYPATSGISVDPRCLGL